MKDFLAFLAEQHVMHLATSGDAGPHVATLFYALDPRPLRLVFLSARTSRHTREILRDSRAAVAIASQHLQIEQLRGVQLWGRVRTPRDLADCLVRYLARFNEVGSYLPEGIFAHLWEFRVERARWIDNRKSFGHHSEWSILQEGRGGGISDL